MPSPCWKCGATKTEPVHKGIIRQLVNLSGYRLRTCSRCHFWRILPDARYVNENSREPEQPLAPGAAADPDPPLPGVDLADPDGFTGCPRCGSRHFVRTHRNWLDRGMRRPPMARCRACNKRFSYPQV